MTDRQRRPTLVPRWAWIVIAATVLLALTGVGAHFLSRPRPITVPSIEGLEGPVARSRLAQVGLLMTYGDSRFSAEVPAGGVLEQDPPPGSEVQPGTVVVVVVSAGSDTFVLPDLLGAPSETARVQLESRGLVVEIEAVPSDAAPGTVVAMTPMPGTEVSTGTVIRLTVAGSVGSDVLLPSNLRGVVVVLDPEPPTEGRADIAMEVTRHVRSLLEASKAEVLVTRSIVETTAPEAVRAAWSAESSPTVVLGIGTGERAGGERVVYTLPSTPERTDVFLPSVDLARLVVTRLVDAGESAKVVLPVEDRVLDAARAPGVRILLGDPADAGNIERFADPGWVDRVSRALYQAIVVSVERRSIE